MTTRWTFTADSDPRLDNLRRQLLSRSTRSAETEPLGYANFEVRAVSPAIPLEAASLSDLHAVIDAFLADLGPEFPLGRWLPAWWSPDSVDMNRVEMDLWGTLVAGIDFSRGVYQAEPELAAAWVASLLVFLDEAGGSRHFQTSHLFDVHGSTSIAWFIVAPTRVAMVCLVGTD